MVTERAPAKINLFLHVVGRRPDGYHLLDSLAVFAAMGDRLSGRQSTSLGLELTGPMAFGLEAGDNNLVRRAACLLASALDIPPHAALTLEKHLPLASGIGGGSADAAATLRLLMRLWQRSLPQDQLSALAARLGADVPVCLPAQPARMQGIGEILGLAPRLPRCGLVLVNPGIAVATKEVFAGRAGSFSPPADLPLAWNDANEMAATLRGLRNDLEAPARRLCPAIDVVLGALARHPAVLLARMSGSGATCFGLTETAEAAEKAASAVARPGWWCWGGSLADPQA